MAGVERLEHVVRFFAVTNLADDEPVWAHSECVLHQVSDIEPPLLRRLTGELPQVNALELDPVGIVEL